MKKIILLSALFIVSFNLFGQEICNNAIDDDGDGLIDLNDDECTCGGLSGVIESLIPNPSFEEKICCPDGPVDLVCAYPWIQASLATSDYFNTCGFTGFGGMYGDPAFPIPSGGHGYVGFACPGDYYLEYVGSALISPLLGGTEYTLNLWTAWSVGPVELDLTIYGTSVASDLPWLGSNCPTGYGDWEEIGSVHVVYEPDGSWQEVTIVFTPLVDIQAIAIGSSCSPIPAVIDSYYYLDELVLVDSESFSNISESGSLCDNNLVLTASTDTSGGSWQWYKEGIALLGETSTIIDIELYGIGNYTAVYTVGDNCQQSDYMVNDLEGISADFDFTPVCLGDEINFTNTSIYGDEVDPSWQWDFGDATTSTDENPNHIYGTVGTYTVQLIGINEIGCNDTVEFDVTVDPIPTADFEFVIDGVSSEDGLTGSCLESMVQFNSLSTIDPPGVITSWNWNFGDGETSILENPTHDYLVAGTYTVTLTVKTDNGCSSSASLSIIMTEKLSIDLVFNEPTCYGFSDGSVTVNVLGGFGELIFKIMDSDGNVLNEENSNTANSLPTGWYYINVDDDSDCYGIDSIFLDQPGQLNIDITVTDPLCYGLKTGWARVNEVVNFTGSETAINYLWSPNLAGNNGLGADSTWMLGAGEYTLTINDENGCSRLFDFTVNQPDSLEFVEFNFDPAYCRIFDYQNGNGVVYGAVTGGTADYTYTWKNLATGDEIENTTWGGLNPGNYLFTATDANGCVKTGQLFLDSLNPMAAFNVISDQLNSDLQGTAQVEVVFENKSENFANPNNPLADTTFYWNLNKPYANWQLSTSYFEIVDTIYGSLGQSYQAEICLVAFNKNGCKDTACKIITIYEPIVLEEINIFSPNGDAKNDVFTFDLKSASIREFKCIIVNRWGVVVAEMYQISDGWDGTDKSGENCSAGVYFYTYEAITDNGTKLKSQGTVQLVR